MRCSQCAQEHPDEDMELTFRRPDAVVALSPEDRSSDVRESDDVCLMRGGRFFVRGVLPLPVTGRSVPYRIGLWVEVDETAYARVDERWNDPDQADEPAMPARVANAIPNLPDTLGLDAALRLTGPRSRPDIFVADPSHPLALEQAGGITAHRAFEYTLLAMRGGGGGPVH